MAGNVVSNVKKYYGGQVPVPGQGDSDGKVKMLVEKTATIEIGGVQTEAELLYDSDDLTIPVTPQQLGQWTDENYLIAFKKREDDGRVRGFVLYALETDSTSTDTLVNRAEFISFKEDMTDPGASAYEFTMVEDSSTLTRYLRDENGELIVKFNQATVEAGAQSGTLDNLIGSDSEYMHFEVVHDENNNAYLNLNTESLDGELDDIYDYLGNIWDIVNARPSDEHGYFNSTLIQTPGDGTTENIIIDDFRISQGGDVHGESIEFVPTHQEGGVDFGEVYLNPGTYIFTVQYTLQWVGYPRGTFLPLVTNVGDRPFDFSYEHEDTVRTTRIVTRTTRGKFSLSFPFDADTPQMGIWVKNLEIAQIASYNHPAVAHDTTLAGTGKLDSPLGVTPAAFGKVKDIPTSISQFRTGDVIPVDGPNGPAKMPKDDLLKETAQNALAGNLAQAFDPTRDEEHPYLADETVMYEGITYIFKNDHFGAWNASDVEVYNNLASRVKDNEKTATNVKGHFSFVEDEGNLYVVDSFGAICLIIDGSGHLIVPSVTGPGGEFGLTDENGNAALKVDYSGNVRLNVALDSLQKNLNKAGTNLSACGGDYFLSTPKYVFGTESSTFRGREYFTALYPEGCVDIDVVQFLIDGFRKKLFQKKKSSTSTDNTPVSEEIVHCSIKAPFFRKKDFAVAYIRANRKNAQNKKIFWLAIGDSLTARKEQTYPDGTVYGGYVNGVKQFVAMDNVDIGNIDVVALGTLNQETETIEYENDSIACKTINAGRGGWTTWDFANFFEHTPLQNSSTSSNLSKEALYYAIGLATKTPFDSSTPGQDYVAFTDTEETRYDIVSTPIGRFKPDCNAILWEALKLRSDFTGTGDYNAETSDPVIEAYLLAKETDPTNEFYSLTAARAYTGEHEWTYTCAFSMSEYLGRYRTYDDDGNQLTIGEGTGSKVNSSNINTYVVMAPTHLTVCLGTNDNGINGEHQKDIVMLLMNEIKAQLPNANIGYFLPRNTGVYDVGTWSDRGLLNHKSGKPETRSAETNKMIMEAIGSLPSGAGLSYIPVYFTSSPISTSGYDRVVEDIDSGDKLIVAGIDDYHPSAYWYKSTAYQVLSWIYWTLR